MRKFGRVVRPSLKYQSLAKPESVKKRPELLTYSKKTQKRLALGPKVEAVQTKYGAGPKPET
jgi:hypothetical protein